MNNLRLVGSNGKKSILNLNGTELGGKEVILMGGPCAVESPEQMREAARVVKEAGGKVLRGGIFKPRTSPYSFQGLGQQGLDYLVDAARERNLLCVTEVIDTASLETVIDKIDIIQIGARNMQNFQLLKEAGKTNKPIILKRGLAATVEEWLLAAEYVMAGGNSQVILCERGIRTFEPSTRNTLDLSAVAVAKELSHLPVIVDPSHAAGRTDVIPALAKAAIAGGADGLLIEMHPNPAEAKSDGAQSLTPVQFRQLAGELGEVARSVNRCFAGANVVDLANLESFRAEIDRLDDKIVQLLGERMSIVKQVGGEKSIDKIRDSVREKEILERLGKAASCLGVPTELISEMYSLIFDFGVRYQLKNKLGLDNDLANV